LSTPLHNSVPGSAVMLRATYSLMMNTVLTAGLGLGFWILAARLFPTESVGRDAALISAMIALSALFGMNLQNVLLRFLPARPYRAWRPILGSYGLGALSTGVGATVFVLLMPAVSSQFAVLSSEVAWAIFYVLSVVSWTVFAMQDAALTALRLAAWVPVENAVYGVLKLAALVPLAALGFGHGVFVAWVVPMMLLLIPVNVLLFRRLISAREGSAVLADAAPRAAGRALAVKFAAQDAVGSVLNVAALTLLPLLVLALLGGRATAQFYMPFMIVATFDLLFLNVGASLVAEGARDESALPLLMRSIVRRFLPLLIAGVAVLVVAAPLVLMPFGDEYADAGTDVLRIMALASLFRGAIMLFVAVSRLRKSGTAILVTQTAFSIALMTLVVLLADPLGLRGIAISWLAAAAIVGIGVLPALIRVTRSGHASPSDLAAVVARR
jgi:hypothetical protein